MSLILEALRKSEAERQRGRAPGLFVEQVPVSRRQRRAPAWAWGPGVLLLVVLALFAWREWGRSAATGKDDASTAGPAVTETAAPTPRPAQPPDLPPGPAATGPAAAPASAAITAPAAAPAPAPAPPRPVVAPTPASTPASVPAPTPATAPSPAPAATDAPQPVEATELALPTLANLDASERAGLPSLRLSMHVYAEEPAQRFVILDGQRLGEGASPAPGVVLEQIRRDGLVLSVNGRRLLLPRP